MTEGVRQSVRERAGHRGEYCRLRQQHLPRERFQIEHIIARQHGGGDSLENLCLACLRCNLNKGPNLSGIDPDGDGKELVPLFNPRQDEWGTHFRFEGAIIVGLTPVGRTSVWVLGMNEVRRVALRRWLLELGEVD